MLPTPRWLIIAAAATTFTANLVANAQVLGGACDVAVDIFGCQGRNYMSCDPQSKRWILQNLCPTDCLGIPSFAQNCGRNSHGVEGPAPSSTAPATTVSSSVAPSPASTTTTTTASVPLPSNAVPIATGIIAPTQVPTDPSNRPPDADAKQPLVQGQSDNRKGLALIIGLAVGGAVLIAAIAAVAIVIQKRNHTAHKHVEGGITSEMSATKPLFSDGVAGNLNVASVLEKRYVVAHIYHPAADDEIGLNVGDIVRLSLLFNDGWAKGVNETTGQQGLLPCACIQELPLASDGRLSPH